MHADRTNRAALILLALLLIAAGLFGALAGFGAFGSATQHGPLVSDEVSGYFGGTATGCGRRSPLPPRSSRCSRCAGCARCCCPPTGPATCR